MSSVVLHFCQQNVFLVCVATCLDHLWSKVHVKIKGEKNTVVCALFHGKVGASVEKINWNLKKIKNKTNFIGPFGVSLCVDGCVGLCCFVNTTTGITKSLRKILSDNKQGPGVSFSRPKRLTLSSF